MMLDDAMRAQFWKLNAEIKAVEARLLPLINERNAMADAEALMREKAVDIGRRKRAIMAETNLVEMTQERSRCVQFLGGKTGVGP